MLTQHHTHYKELDGYDEIVIVSRSSHTKHHISIGKQIPQKIVWNAYRRSPKGRKTGLKYKRNNIKHIYLSTNLSKGINLMEDINYNTASRNLWCVSYFTIDKRYANINE